MEEPLVSVLIPTFSRKEKIIKALESVFNQTYGNLEVIVADDGSKDGTYEAVSDFFRKNLTTEKRTAICLRNSKNQGFVKTLTILGSHAKGKYIARIDDDDVWIDPEKTKKQVDFLEKNPEYVLVGSGAEKIGEGGKKEYFAPEKDRQIRKKILLSNCFVHSAVIFRTHHFRLSKGYKEEYGFFADWELWLNLGSQGKIYNFNQIFVRYSNNESDSSHDLKIRRRLKESLKMKKMYRRYYSHYLLGIIFSLLSYFYSFLPLRIKILKIKNIFKI